MQMIRNQPQLPKTEGSFENQRTLR